MRDAKGRFVKPPFEPVQPAVDPVVEVVSVDEVFTAPETPVVDVREFVATTDVEWDQDGIIVLKESLNIGHKADGRWYMMAYDDSTANPGNMLCNRLDGTGDCICRLRRDHAGEKHLPFHVHLVVQSGIYVDQIGPDPAQPRPPVKEA